MGSVVYAKQCEEIILENYNQTNAIDRLREFHDSLLMKMGIDTTNPSSTEVLRELWDMAIRRVVLQLSKELSMKTDAMEIEKNKNKNMKESSYQNLKEIEIFLDFCIHGALNKLIPNTIPYRIIEVLMETQKIHICEEIWKLIENRKEQLTMNEFKPQNGKNTKVSFCLLRLCNALLKRLSKTKNHVFCGRILFFLAFILPLSERSGLNLAGKSNIKNVTLFETEEDFLENELRDPSPKMDNDVDMSDITIDYKLYHTFWDLQRFFTKCNLALESKDKWEEFFAELEQVLQALEVQSLSSTPLTTQESPNLVSFSRNKQEYESTEDMADDNVDIVSDNSIMPTGTATSCKYLTNSRLFHLQLTDPIIRKCIISQLLILLQHMTISKPPSDITTLKSKIEQYEKRAYEILNRNPDSAVSYAKVIKLILERERHWIKWKNEKCPAYEKKQPGGKFTGILKRKLQEITKSDDNHKRKMYKPSLDGFISMMKPRTNKKNIRGKDILMELITSKTNKTYNALEVLKGDASKVNTYYDELTERFVEYWDPENGIEEEYGPMKDTTHCWRTMRSILRHNLSAFNDQGVETIVKTAINYVNEKATEPKKENDNNIVSRDDVIEDGEIDENEGKDTIKEEKTEIKKKKDQDNKVNDTKKTKESQDIKSNDARPKESKPDSGMQQEELLRAELRKKALAPNSILGENYKRK